MTSTTPHQATPTLGVDDQRALVAALARRLRERAGSVHAIETHISHVLVAGEDAYKLKKPLTLPFLDYSTLALRKHACEEELRINRRLAPALYLGIVAVRGTVAQPAFDGDGPVLDYAVHMRAFAQDALLSAQLAAGALGVERIDEFALEVAAFHLGLPPLGTDAAWGTPGRALDDALENFDELRSLLPASRGKPLSALEAWTRAEFARCAQAMAQRRRDGFVRECHGDMHLRNAVLVDGRVTIFDGIEFNPALRWIDVAAEAAFAVMDLADRGRDDYAWRFLNTWMEATGDYGAIEVLRFHLVYRAMVRAKVHALRAAQLGRSDEARRLHDEADRYVALATRLADAVRPGVVLMHGASGAGKSVLSQHLAERLPAVRLRTDVERRRLHGVAPGTRSGSAIDAGLYAREATERTYAHLAEQAARIARAGYVALLDGAFLKRWQRDWLRALADTLAVAFAIVDVDVPIDLLRARVAARAAAGTDASEATLEVLERQLATREALDHGERAMTISVDGSRRWTQAELDDLVAALAARIGAGSP